MTKRLLIVEDNPVNMKLIRVTLRQLGYEILESTDGEAALEVAVRDRPDLIIMDIQLPKLNGWEVTRRLRQMPDFKRIPIIAVTAYAMKGDREKALQGGCDAYLAKPIDIHELRSIVTEMLERQR